MKSKLRFTLSALIWALILLMAYAITTRAQTKPTADQPEAKYVLMVQYSEIMRQITSSEGKASVTIISQPPAARTRRKLRGVSNIVNRVNFIV